MKKGDKRGCVVEKIQKRWNLLTFINKCFLIFIMTCRDEAKKIGYPVLIKAVLGGGGKGMRIVEREEDLEDSVNSSKREAISSFGDDRVLVEKYLRHPRYIFSLFPSFPPLHIYLSTEEFPK
jgi:hypothetical protein